MLHRLAELDAEIREAYADLRLPQGRRRAVAVHEHGAVGVLFRHPQGRALLRALFEREAARGADRHRRRSSAALVAWLAPILSFTAEEAWLARYPGRRRLGASRDVPGDPDRPGATTRWPRSGSRCATCAASSPARSRSSARPSASAPASRPRPRSTSPTRDMLRGARRRRSRRSVHHQRLRGSSPRRRPRAPSRCPTCRASASCRSAREGKKCARSWRITDDVGADPDFPDLSPRDAAAVREFDARTGAAQLTARRAHALHCSA